ncbi:MAG: hypothetical protein QOH66_2650 [Actinomycetota bacterium]|nr:hypothetical protein [Actinomycetota bacterium]
MVPIRGWDNAVQYLGGEFQVFVIQIVRRPLTSDGIVVPMVARSLEWPDLQTLLPAWWPGARPSGLRSATARDRALNLAGLRVRDMP